MAKQPNDSNVMKPADFKRWRKTLKLSQKEAAEALGLKRRVVQYYEKGERDGEKVQIPKYIRLACSAVASGVADYDGPPRDKDPAAPEPLGEPQSTSD
ncbi:helix-turn-helix transcriptional regulator [Thalassobaculum sp. OXR-137]|uniref:helix-turn-helix domain-containing protein n=1 Tax=Thalassobaculum sp. OXR-137 TaxID=3100173 RepID=UPI002AC8EDB5|nr:helix-turn-helix transcriptional regulator [Thalassobaculum sp. OXR-137]WPZ35206.1 helix-turn-helix transcriptional regulator [Thalassobaculum sp. OXR-137]